MGIGVRLARPDEGPVLHELFLASGKWEIEGLDWTQDMTPYWLIAEDGNAILGCIMVRAGRPLGSLEFLCIPEEMPHKLKAQVAKTLLLHGMQSLKLSGSQVVGGMLPPGLEGYEKVLTRRGAVKWFDGSAYLRKL